LIEFVVDVKPVLERVVLFVGRCMKKYDSDGGEKESIPDVFLHIASGETCKT